MNVNNKTIFDFMNEVKLSPRQEKIFKILSEQTFSERMFKNCMLQFHNIL